jgi:hypothetical protein
VPSLFVTCRGCRFEFPSGLALTGPIDVLSVFGIRHQCPRCLSEAAYFTSEYHFVSGTEPAPGLSPFLAPRPTEPMGGLRHTFRSESTGRAPFGWLTSAWGVFQ